ncbi:glycosyltransferase [Vibrio splendidus]
MGNKKILILCDEFEGGGAEKVAFDTYKMLAKDSTISVFSSYSSKNADFPLDDASKKNILSRLFDFQNLILLYKGLIKLKPDVIHVHNFSSKLTFSVLVSIILYRLKFNVLVVHTLHDHHLVCPNSSFYNVNENSRCTICVGRSKFNVIRNKCYNGRYLPSVIKFLRFKCQSSLLKVCVSKFISPSKFVIDNSIGDGIGKDKLNLVYNPIDDIYFLDRPKLNKSNDVLFIGRIVSIKGIDVLLDAWSNQKFQDAVLHIVGSGDDSDYLIKKYAHISQRVVFHGRLSPKEIRQLSTRVSTLVLPSIVFENAPLVLYEAVQLGLYPVTSNIGGMKEAIELLDFGHCFEANDPSSLVSVLMSARDTVNGHDYVEDLERAQDIVNKNCKSKYYVDELLSLYGVKK